MKIKILSDSTCDLPKNLLSEMNISTVPLTVVKGDAQFKDGVTITPAEIFDHVAQGGALCTTAANSIGEYEDMFAQYADWDGVILITIGSGFSACYQNATLAAEEFPNVRVVDSMNLSTGQGLVVLKAWELAQTATDLDQLAEEVRAYTAKIESSFLVEKLDYLVKGGRCSSAAALGANLLNLKPCIEVNDGKMGVGKKYRGNYTKSLVTYVNERLEGRTDIDRMFITKTVVSEECFDAVMAAVRTHLKEEQILVSDAGCTVSCHCGPGTLGLLMSLK